MVWLIILQQAVCGIFWGICVYLFNYVDDWSIPSYFYDAKKPKAEDIRLPKFCDFTDEYDKERYISKVEDYIKSAMYGYSVIDAKLSHISWLKSDDNTTKVHIIFVQITAFFADFLLAITSIKHLNLPWWTLLILFFGILPIVTAAVCLYYNKNSASRWSYLACGYERTEAELDQEAETIDYGYDFDSNEAKKNYLILCLSNNFLNEFYYKIIKRYYASQTLFAVMLTLSVIFGMILIIFF